MIEMYITKQVTEKGKTVNLLERIDKIQDDCWINMFSPTEEELHLVEEKVEFRRNFSGIPLMKKKDRVLIQMMIREMF